MTYLHKKLTIRASENNKFSKITPDFGSIQGAPIDAYFTHSSVGATKNSSKKQVRWGDLFFSGPL